MYDKALYLYQNAVNLVSEVDEDYRVDVGYHSLSYI